MKKIFISLFLLFFLSLSAEAQWTQVFKVTATLNYQGGVSGGGIYFSPGGLWLVSSGDNLPIKFYSSLDTGKTWTSHTIANSNSSVAGNSIRFMDRMNGIMSLTSTAQAEITSDGGQTWNAIGGGFTDAFMSGSPKHIIGTVFNMLFESRDGGITYSLIAKNSSLSFAATPKGVIYLGNNPIMESRDNGVTWQPKKGKYDTESWSMAVGQNCDDTTIYISSEEFAAHNGITPNADGDGIGKFIASIDGGNTFFPVLTNAFGIITGSVVTSKNAAFCGTRTDLGIIRTTDKGKSWQSIGGPPSPIDCRNIAAINDNTLFVLDTLGILWRTDNCGGFPITQPPPPMPQINATSAKATSCDSGKASASLMHNYCDVLTITDATLAGADAPYFTLLPPGLPVSLGNGAKVNFNLNFNPKKEVRSFSAQIHVKGFYIFEYEDTIRIDTLIDVKGTSTPVPPNLVASPSIVDFGKITTCISPKDTIITLTNKGCDTLEITDTSGFLTGDFRLLTQLKFPIKIPPDSSFILTFRFSTNGTPHFIWSGLDFIAVQQTLQQKLHIFLQGQTDEIYGILSVSPKKFSFPTLSICSHDSASGFITNIGCDSLWYNPAMIAGDTDFKFSPEVSKFAVLHPKDTIKYIVRINPAQKGLRQGNLILSAEAGIGFFQNDTIPFTVTVTDGTRILATSTNALDFGTTTLCEDRDSIIYLANHGCDTLEVSGVGGLVSGFGTNTKFPIIILPGHDTIIHIFTILDTSGGKTSNTALLTFTSTSDNTLTPIILNRSYVKSRLIDLGLFLDPTIKKGGDTDIVNFDIKESSGKSFTGAGIKQITFDLLNHNTDLLQYTPSKNTPNLTSPDGKSFTISGSPEITADGNGILASVGFRVYLTKDSVTTIDLVNAKIDTTHPPCTTLAFSASGSATFDYQFICGERSISGFMNGVMPMKIISMRPNPAQDEIEIDLESAIKQDANIEIRNALGACVYSGAKNLTSGPNSIHLNTKGLASGMYLVRVGKVSQSLVISR